jgi:hypothetical protein
MKTESVGNNSSFELVTTRISVGESMIQNLHSGVISYYFSGWRLPIDGRPGNFTYTIPFVELEYDDQTKTYFRDVVVPSDVEWLDIWTDVPAGSTPTEKLYHTHNFSVCQDVWSGDEINTDPHRYDIRIDFVSKDDDIHMTSVMLTNMKGSYTSKITCHPNFLHGTTCGQFVFGEI